MQEPDLENVVELESMGEGEGEGVFALQCFGKSSGKQGQRSIRHVLGKKVIHRAQSNREKHYIVVTACPCLFPPSPIMTVSRTTVRICPFHPLARPQRRIP